MHLVLMTKKERSRVVERMLQREQREGVARPALRVKITREGQVRKENPKEERLVRLAEKKTRDFMVGLKGEGKMTWENIVKKKCGCGQDPCKTYGSVKKYYIKKGKGERHFYIEDGKPVQWTGETHKHPDGTLMSGKEHVEGKSKKLFHFYELDDKYLRHLSKDTTRNE